MKNPRLSAACAFLLLLSALPAVAQQVPLEIEAGYRWLDVTGNSDMYRTQIGEREGLYLRSLTYSGNGFADSLMDSIRIDASDLGVGPAGSFRLTAGYTGAYRLDVSYRRTEMFSAETLFANPLAARGVTRSQHTMDRVRHMFGVELEVLPGAVVTPIVGYTRNRYEGPGTTTIHLGENEFLLTQNIFDTDQEFHVGLAFQAGIVSGRVVQGWRKFVSNENLALAPGAGSGNVSTPILNVNDPASTLTGYGRTDSNSPVTSAIVTVAPIQKVKIVASYLKSNADTADSSLENASGSFASFYISRFFGGLSESTQADARNKYWRGAARAEVSILDGLDLTAGYTERSRELTGSALISSLYIDSTTFAGLDRKDILQLVSTNSTLERNDRISDAALSYKALGPVTLRVGYAYEKQRSIVSESAAEILVPGAQGGEFDRTVERLDAGLSFRMAGAFLDADYQNARGDRPVVRTDFITRDRYRVRAGYGFASLFKIALSAEQIDTKNDWTGIDRDGRMRQYGGDLTVTPLKWLWLRASGHRFQNDNSITYRIPQSFNLGTSVYAEDGKSYEGGLGVTLSNVVSLEGSFARLENSGDSPFRMTRGHLGADLAVDKDLAVVLDWAHDKYEENDELHWGNFNANRYGIYLRYHPQ